VAFFTRVKRSDRPPSKTIAQTVQKQDYKYVIVELLCKLSITSWGRSGWLSAGAASGDAVK
jgi:hypothetical protein